MKTRRFVVLAGVLTTACGAATFVAVSIPAHEASAARDPRQDPPLVRLATAASVAGSERGLTGTVGARVQSNLGFRVPGKIVERLVDGGQEVRAGQPPMRIDETDLRLALTAKRNAVAATRASAVELEADERRYAGLLDNGWVSRQRYEQAKAALDTAEAQLAAAEAEARVAENEATYAVLVADTDGTVVETLGEPGRSSSPASQWSGSPGPAPAKRWSLFPKRSGRRSARWPRPACSGTMVVAIRPISGNCRIPPMPRHGPTRPVMCSTARRRQHPSARR